MTAQDHTPRPPLARDRAAQVPQDPRRRGRGRRRRADHRPVDDQHADRRRRRRPSTRSAQLEEAGADIVRVSCPDEDVDRRPADDRQGRQGADRRRHPLPLQARHRGGRGRRGLPAHQPRQHRLGAAGARSDPGRRGPRLLDAHRRQRRLAGAHLLEKYGEPCPEAMVESALDHARILQDHDFHEFKISVKASDVFLTVAAYQQLAEAIDCPLHLGVTEAGADRARARSSRRSASARCSGPASATPSASRSPPIRSRRSRSASTS